MSDLEKSIEISTLADSLRRITKHSFIYGLGSVIGNIISFFLIPIYTRFLTTADYGILSSMAAVDSILMIILVCGLQGAVFRFYFKETEIRRKEMVGSIWLFQMSISLVLFILLYLGAGNIAIFVFRDLNMRPYLKLVIMRVFFSTGALIPLVLYRAQEKSFRYICLTLLTAIVGTCLNIYFVVILRKGALGSLQAGVITAILLYLSYLILMLKEIIFTFRWEFVFRGLLFGLPLLPHDLGGWILNLSDRILMQRLASKEELGLYALGCNLSLALGLVTLAINNAWAPFFLSVAEKKEGPPIISKLMTYYLFFICFIALGMSVFSKEITYIMAASDYREAHKVIPLIVLSYIFQGMYFMATNCLFLKEKTKYLPFITFSAAATNFVLNLLWIPRYGMMGAAGATVIAFVLYFLITFFVSKRFYVLSYEKERVTKIFLAAIILYLISTAIRTKSLAYSLSLKTVLLFGYFLGLFLLRFFNKDEITKIKIYFGFTNSSKI